MEIKWGWTFRNCGDLYRHFTYGLGQVRNGDKSM